MTSPTWPAGEASWKKSGCKYRDEEAEVHRVQVYFIVLSKTAQLQGGILTQACLPSESEALLLCFHMIKSFKVLLNVLKTKSGILSKFELIVLLVLGKASADITQETSRAQLRVVFK